MEDKKYAIKMLLFIAKDLNELLYNLITEQVLRDKPIDYKAFRESLIYHIDMYLSRLED